MWDDLPKKTSPGTKIFLVILVLIVLAGIGYVVYTLFLSNQKTPAQTLPSAKISAKNSSSFSPSASIRPSISPSTKISPSATPDYKIPQGETFVIASTEDTNGDTKDESLVITRMANNKYHVYILSSDGQSLFDDKELLKKPVRIDTQTYDPTKETYLSWVLIFTENSGDMAVIHWNGTKYEIPQNEIGI